MATSRKQTPKGEAYTPNPEPDMEYTRTVNVTKLSRRTKESLGYVPRGKATLPKGKNSRVH